MLIYNDERIIPKERFSLSSKNTYWNDLAINQILGRRKFKPVNRFFGISSTEHFVFSESSYLVAATLMRVNNGRRTLRNPCYKYAQFFKLEYFDTHHFWVNLNLYEDDIDLLDDFINTRQKVYYYSKNYVIPLKYSYKNKHLATIFD